MRIASKQRRKAITETDMVSMSDIAFLLIIFFMITTQFMRDTTLVEVPELPGHDRTESGIAVALDAEGTIWLDGEALSGPEALEAELLDRLAGRTEPEQREVRFRCQADLTQQRYGPVMEAISAAGGVVSIIIERRDP